MHQRKSALLLTLLLALCLSLGACGKQAAEDSLLAQLGLEGETAPLSLDLRDRELTVQQYRFLESTFPDCEILWNVPLSGGIFPSDSWELHLTAFCEADRQLLRLFPALERICAPDCPDYALLAQLAADHPDLQISYNISLGGAFFSSDAEAVTLPGDQVEQAAAMLPYFRNLKKVTIAEPLPEASVITKLREAHPHVEFSWSLTFRDLTLDNTLTELDLTGMALTVGEVEMLLSYLPNLTHLDVSDCGIDDAQLDALNRQYENVRIVWTVSIGKFIRIKTDTTWFMPAKFGYNVETADVYNLRYCTEIVALDLGHMKISNCDFAAFMPKLKYLILADTEVKDLTPLTGLKELVFLELFMSEVQDYTPLTTLTSLEDLNLHYTRGNADALASMTWLKNLWWNKCTDAEQAMLREALPDCRFNCTSISSTGEGWRKLENYYAQRDILGMSYMTD